MVSTYQYRTEEDRYSKRVSLEEIAEKHSYNLNISRYISTSAPEKKISLQAVNNDLASLEKKVVAATKKHNKFLKELGLPFLFGEK